MSSVSSSWRMFVPRQAAQAVASSTLTVISSQSSQYQAGMLWPHQIWRLMHQSRMSSSQRM